MLLVTELAADPRFAKRDGRAQNADELHAMIGEWSRQIPLADVLSRLEAEGAPAAEVRFPAAAVKDQPVLDRGEVVRLRHPEADAESDLVGPGMPFLMSGAETTLDRPAPRLGQDILSQLLGYPDAKIDDLKRSGVL
ncbi:CoA transferase [Paenarthrobacter nicotinovorans]|nr:CoA transferase [Paenarthrobacter nicotinovorans]